MRRDNSELNRESIGRVLLRSGVKIALLFVVLVGAYGFLLGYLAYAS